MQKAKRTISSPVNNAKIFDCYCLSFRRLAVRRKSSESCCGKGERTICHHNRKVAEWRGNDYSWGGGVSQVYEPLPPAKWGQRCLPTLSHGGYCADQCLCRVKIHPGLIKTVNGSRVFTVNFFHRVCSIF